MGRDTLLEKLIEGLYNRNDAELKAGRFRVREAPWTCFRLCEQSHKDRILGDEIEGIREIDAISGSTIGELENYRVYPASQYASTKEKVAAACKAIEKELEERVAWFERENLLLEAQRIRMRPNTIWKCFGR